MRYDNDREKIDIVDVLRCYRHNLSFQRQKDYELHLEIDHGIDKRRRVPFFKSCEVEYDTPKENEAHSSRFSKFFGD